MSKYFSAKVTVQQTFQVNVVAEDEASATRNAREIDYRNLQPISTRVTDVELALEDEASYEVGTRIKHLVFGAGKIKKLVRTTDANKTNSRLFNDLKFSTNGEPYVDILRRDGRAQSNYCDRSTVR